MTNRIGAFIQRRKLLCVLLAIFILTASSAGAYFSYQNIGSKDAASKITKAIRTGTLDEEAQEAIINSADDVGPNTGSAVTPSSPKSSNGSSVRGTTPPSSTSSSSPSSTSSSSSSPTPSPNPEPTPPPDESPSAIVAFYADNQSDSDAEDQNHQRMVNYILATGANPVFHAGDLMEDGTEDSLNRFNSVTATLRSSRTFYAALGNNDRVYGDTHTPSPLFLNNFSFPNNEQWYSVNIGNLHMVVLDSAFSWGDSAQRSWLLSDLQSASSQSKITGVMFHHPDFASEISQHLINNGVDFVVAGHIHSYGHTSSNGVHYFTTSGQPSLGYLVAKIYQNNVSISAYNSANSLIETINFSER